MKNQETKTETNDPDPAAMPGATPLTGTLILVGTSSEPQPDELNRPRILIYTTEVEVQAVERIPFLKPVVVLSSTDHADLLARVRALEDGLERFMRAGNLVPKMGGGYTVSGWSSPRLEGAANHAAALLSQRRAT